MNKVIEYNSGSMQGGLFTMKKAVKVQEAATDCRMLYNYFTDDNYQQFFKEKSPVEKDEGLLHGLQDKLDDIESTMDVQATNNSMMA